MAHGSGTITDAQRDAARAMLAALEGIKQFGELNCVSAEKWPYSPSGKKPATKDVWQFPRFMLTDIDDVIAAAKAAGITPQPRSGN